VSAGLIGEMASLDRLNRRGGALSVFAMVPECKDASYRCINSGLLMSDKDGKAGKRGGQRWSESGRI